jgi:predicted nucleic acid-binding protein
LQKDYQIVEITENIINSGMVLSETYGLRGYDAIQLAVGRVVNTISIANGLPTITFVSADTALPAAIRYILKAESDDRRGARRKIYRIRAGSAVMI